MRAMPEGERLSWPYSVPEKKPERERVQPCYWCRCSSRDTESERAIVNWYDKNGQPIDIERWAGLMARPEYRRVAEDFIDEFWVSTVWLGLDHGIDGNKMIFETMIFTFGNGAIVYGPVRYTTLGAATAGHKYVVRELKRREHGKWWREILRARGSDGD